MTARQPQEGRKRHQIIAETGRGNEIWDEIERKQQIGEGSEHGEPHLGRRVAIQQQFQAFQGRQSNGTTRPAQQALQHPFIDNGAFQHLRLHGGLIPSAGFPGIGGPFGGVRKTGVDWSHGSLGEQRTLASSSTLMKSTRTVSGRIRAVISP